jgi:hypothetical protein
MALGACARHGDFNTDRDVHTSVFGGQPVDSNAPIRQSALSNPTASKLQSTYACGEVNGRKPLVFKQRQPA